MKKRKRNILLILFAFSVVILVGLAIIFPIILDTRWLPFWIALIIISTAWLIYGIVELVKMLNKKIPELSKIQVGKAKEFHRNRLQEDIDNGDNVKFTETILGRYGEQGKEPTPIAIFDGTGSEKGQRRTVLTNLNNYKDEFTDLIDATDETIDKLKKKISENPPDDRFEESEVLTNFGIQKTKRPYNPSSQSKRNEIEQKQVEETNSI